MTSSWATAVRAIMTAVGFWICISRKRTFPSLVSLMSAGHKQEDSEMAQSTGCPARRAWSQQGSSRTSAAILLNGCMVMQPRPQLPGWGTDHGHAVAINGQL